MITGWILYGMLGALLSAGSIDIVNWQFYAILVNVIGIDVWSHVCARKRK